MSPEPNRLMDQWTRKKKPEEHIREVILHFLPALVQPGNCEPNCCIPSPLYITRQCKLIFLFTNNCRCLICGIWVGRVRICRNHNHLPFFFLSFFSVFWGERCFKQRITSNFCCCWSFFLSYFLVFIFSG